MKKIVKYITTGILVFTLSGQNFVYANSGVEEKKTVHILYYWGETDNDASAPYLKELLNNDFANAFPNVELVQDICDNETYKKKIKVLMATDELPDIMFGYGAGFSEIYAEKGKVLFLNDYLNDFYKEHINMDLQESFMYEDQLYGICFSSWTGILYCNKTLFQKAGVEIPQTYEELLNVCEKFREKSIEPVACGMMNKWQGQQWINNFTIQLAGADLYNDMAQGKISMNNEFLRNAAQLTENLVQSGVFCRDIYQLTSGEAEEKFLDGNAAMIYIGSWFTNSALERLGDQVEVAKMPVIPGAIDTKDFHGGGSNGWMVSADTEYPELCTEIVAWLAYQLGCYQPQNTTFFIDEKDKKVDISTLDKKIMEIYQDKENGGVAWDTLMKPENADTWLDMCSKLFEGTINGREFAKILGEEIW